MIVVARPRRTYQTTANVMPFGMPKDVVATSLKLPADLNEALKALAAEDRRSVNATIIVVLQSYVETRRRQQRVAAIGAEIASKHAELLRRLA